jgi:hypothetical protein
VRHPLNLFRGPRLSEVALLSALAILAATTGCVRLDGRNSDCRWPPEGAPHAATPWHLGQDAEFAEDLAIRYADVHHGLRTPYYVSGEAYDAARDRCMTMLFAQAAQEHGVPVERVSSALGHNRRYFDAAEVLPFALLYCFLAFGAARLISRRYPIADGWIAFLLVALLCSAGFAAGGNMLGEVWSWLVEGYRVGNPHISYRAQRLVWSRHPALLFACGFVLFWAAALATVGRRRRRIKNQPPTAGLSKLPS